ncbi:MAG: VWA domain-containing protein [Akkermansiaceae bacterium]|nr:VWA domain-containing protein [Akkermansiaceae bacterium]
MKAIFPTLAATEWRVSFEGISPGLAFALFVVASMATVFAYWKFAGSAPRWRKILMAFFRIAAVLVLAALLAKPVLNLTVHDPVRQPLLVLVDDSESMRFEDRREGKEDLERAEIATGSRQTGIPRNKILEGIAASPKLDLWPRLSEQSDLLFHQFGRNVSRVASPEGELKREDAAKIFSGLKYGESATAIGEAVRQVLQEPRPQPAGGVLLVTDGANNGGSSPIEAAQIAKEQGVPLFIYGVGVTSPRDVQVREVIAQKLAFVEEKLEVRGKIASRSMEEKAVTASLIANGEIVDGKEITIGGDREQEVSFTYEPKVAGELKLEISIPVQPDEAGKDNNIASALVRVTDSKFNVLLIEQEPRWDFRYLLDYLQRDPRLEVKCVMIDGEPGLDQIENSPFLPSLPESRDAYFKSQVIILGDVNPEDLGEERMQIIAEWVQAGGGIIFLSGPNFSPTAYAGTPLESLLPVVPDTMLSRDAATVREREPFQLQLSRIGENSPYLQMDPDPEENKRIWEAFPGVRWTAPVARVKPGAEVLLVDPRPEKSGRYGLLPVFAMQGYGSGKCVYFGTDETYRWRSRTGEKYYSILWGQIMQTLALQLLEGASSLTQLKSERKQYSIGDTVVISGNAYTEGFEPLLVPTLEGTMKMESGGKAVEEPFELHGIDRNAFRGEFTASTPGSYSFATTRDPEGIVKFEVIDSRPERNQTALDEKLLKSMAEISGGLFFREEDLAGLPDKIAAKSATVATFKKLDLFHNGWFLAALLGFLFLEWLLRRLTQLK